MTSLNPLHTISQQIGEILALHQGGNPSHYDKEIITWLNQVGIRNPETRLGSYPHQLSGGERQRVMIAMSLANRPQLLIADEPTTALDVTVQAQILELLKNLQNDHQMALLLITHDLSIVRHMADEVAVMRNGEIVEAGPTKNLFASPQHEYTKMLINSEPKGRPDAPRPNAKELLKTDKLKVWFGIKQGFFRRIVGHVKAVDGLDITVREGETLAIVGESGSGKTTLALAILRLLSSEGAIAFQGRDISKLSISEMRNLRQDMQVVFQDPFGSLSPRLSIRQIVEEGLIIQNPELNKEMREERVINALNEVGLDASHLERYPHEFSGGQRQRIAIARAMVLNPKFVVLDEPTSALDMSVQAQIVDLLRDLQRQYGLTYLFISHDLRVVRAMAHHVIVMKQGNMVEQGTASQIFSNPKEAYTQNLLAAAMNIKAKAS